MLHSTNCTILTTGHPDVLASAPSSDRQSPNTAKAAWMNVRPRLVVLIHAAFICGVALAVYSATRSSIAIILLLMLLVLRKLTKSAYAILLVFFVFWGYCFAQLRLPHPKPDDVSLFNGRRVTICGVIESCKESRHHNNLVLSVSSMTYPEVKPISGKVNVYVALPRVQNAESPAGPTEGLKPTPTQAARAHKESTSTTERPVQVSQLRVDKSIILRGVLRAPPPPSHPFNFDQRQALALRGVFAEMRVNESGITSVNASDDQCQPGCRNVPLERCLFVLQRNCEDVVSLARHDLVAFHQKICGTEDGKVLSSMVLGDRAVELGDDTRQCFRDSGLSHVLAASGYNLTVVILMVSFATRLVLRSIILNACCCLLGIIAFVSLAGLSPSVSRAAVMCSIILICKCFQRRPHMPAVLSTSLVLQLIYNPAALADIGLQLSYVATTAMIAGSDTARHISNSLTGTARWITEIAVTTLLAQVSVLPLQLFYFYESSTYFLPANIIAGLLVPFISSVGFASSICFLLSRLISCFSLLAGSLDLICLPPLEALLWSVKAISNLPFAVLPLGPPPLYAVLLFYGSLLATLVLHKHAKLTKWCYCGLAATTLILLARGPLETELKIHVGTAKLLIRRDHSAFLKGRADPKKVRRILSYYASRLVTHDK